MTQEKTFYQGDRKVIPRMVVRSVLFGPLPRTLVVEWESSEEDREGL